MSSASEILKQSYFDEYGAPVFHEIEGVRYWGHPQHAESLGQQPEQMDWSESQIEFETAAAMRRRARAEELLETAQAIQQEAPSYGREMS